MTQYGINLREDIEKYPWEDFCDLVSGLSPDTPLGRMVSIRTEKDKDIINGWSEDLKKINRDWQYKRRMIEAKAKTQEEIDMFYEAFKNILTEL